ncbi:hypothetical protein TRFO_29982 [Tritrichomonas foetus]|uniref:Uncharacterized protein n=1 Tax=Tritrichomonas foetus TaxID=1144522 RepID=A0A1J4JVQ4_9EUKA|nr:hypothetical protein TRFO_29982 [Tritrichomonas foetus]|eukprot:OHT02786.1 hypothetical protein TRFO_29982 [Tritrichomonas foetus]
MERRAPFTRLWCNRDRRSVCLIWVIPWIFAGFAFFIFVKYFDPESETENIKSLPVRPTISPLPEIEKIFTPNPTITPFINIPSFEWKDVKWHKNPNDFIQYSYEKYSISGNNSNIHQSLSPEVLKRYSMAILNEDPVYTVLENLTFSPTGHYIVGNSFYPENHPFVSDFDPETLKYLSPAVQFFNDEIIALPVFPTMTDVNYMVSFLPLILAIPKNKFSSAKIICTRVFPGMRDMLMNLGFQRENIISMHKDWFKARKATILRFPTIKTIENHENIPKLEENSENVPNQANQKENEINHKENEKSLIDQNFIETLPIWAINDFILTQQKTFNKIPFHNQVSVLPNPGIYFDMFEEYIHSLNFQDDRIKIIELEKNKLSMAEQFYRSKVVLGFQSDALHLIPFMKKNSLAIIVQAKNVYHRYVHLAKELGVKVRVIGVDTFQDINSALTKEIIQLIAEEYPKDE